MTLQIFKKLVVLIMLLACGTVTWAQQDAQYTQFMYSKLPQNAAYAGSKEALSIRAIYRDQWAAKKGNAIEGAPKTTTFSIHSPLKKEFCAMGFYFVNDRIGLEQKNQFNVTYAYRISLTKKIKLSIGVNTGMLWYKLNVTDAVLVNPDDNKYKENVSRVLPDVGAGIYIYHPNFYVGASCPNFIKGKLANKGDYESGAERVAHFVVMAGGAIPVHKHIKIRPQLQYSYLANAVYKIPHTFDFNLSLMLYDKVNVGAQYHTTFANRNNGVKLTNPDSVDFMVEAWPVKQFMIGYSYDYTLSRLSGASAGTHEIIIGYDMTPKKKKNYHTGCYHF